ncbi:MAG: response regulator [Ignavibacteriaceae bacterium]|nr:response regulator [Ignavibacteriaceae bacterium]
MDSKLYKEIEKLQVFRDLLLDTTKKFIDVSINDLDNLLSDILREVGIFFDCDRSYIFTLDWEKKVTTNTHEWCAEGITPEIENLQETPFEFFQAWLDELQKDNNIHIPSVQELTGDWEPVKEILEPQGIKSLIVVPISFNKQVLGFCGFDAVRNYRNWQDAEISLLRILSNNIASAFQRRESDLELIKAKDAAEMASRAKTEFLANMSHEIRTPLNGVIGFTELLLNTPLNSIQKTYLESAHTSAQTLLSLINDILDFSKIEAGKLDLEIVKCNLVDLVEQTADVVKYEAAKKNLELLLNIQPGLPEFVYCDEIRLRQILVNLLNNAVKFTMSGEVELSVTFRKGEGDHGFFDFFVRDTGIGISLEEEQKLFRAFEQADASTTRKFGGTGLGLAIVNKLLDKMGSSIQLESESGKGSKFSFTLDVKYERGTLSEKEPLHRIRKVLIVDDNKMNRMIVAGMLEYRKIASDTAANGIEALEKIRANGAYDLILLDYHIPYMDGIEVARNIRNKLALDPGKQPVFLLHSSSEDKFINDECKVLGVNTRMIKPVKMSQLFKEIDNAGFIDSSVQEQAGYKENDEPSRPAKGRISILIADDNDFNRLLTKTLVSKNFPTVELLEAEDGEQAVEQFLKNKPNLILMDLQMPVKDGFEATIEIRNYEGDTSDPVPIIALTAGAIATQKDKSIEAGMNDFLTKPIKQDQLFECIVKFLGAE